MPAEKKIQPPPKKSTIKIASQKNGRKKVPPVRNDKINVWCNWAFGSECENYFMPV